MSLEYRPSCPSCEWRRSSELSILWGLGSFRFDRRQSGASKTLEGAIRYSRNEPSSLADALALAKECRFPDRSVIPFELVQSWHLKADISACCTHDKSDELRVRFLTFCVTHHWPQTAVLAGQRTATVITLRLDEKTAISLSLRHGIGLSARLHQARSGLSRSTTCPRLQVITFH
jgi:hypothetical protein